MERQPAAKGQNDYAVACILGVRRCCFLDKSATNRKRKPVDFRNAGLHVAGSSIFPRMGRMSATTDNCTETGLKGRNVKMDIFRRALDQVGRGGVHCYCCNGYHGRERKVLRRIIRRQIKQKDAKAFRRQQITPIYQPQEA